MDTLSFHCLMCNADLAEESRGHVDPSLCGICEDPANRPEPEVARVVIRRFQGGEIIALFPDHDEGRGTISSYMHIGQHGPADRAIVDRTSPVDPDADDVQALLRELVAIGYAPRLMRRLTRP